MVSHVMSYVVTRVLLRGLRPLRRGDELMSVNGTCQFQSMRRQLARTDRVRLQFLKADVVLPLEHDSCDSPTAATKSGPAVPSQNPQRTEPSQERSEPAQELGQLPERQDSTRSPSSQSQPSQPGPPGPPGAAFLSQPPLEGEVADVQCSTAFCAVEHSMPASPPPCSSADYVPDSIPDTVPDSIPPAPAVVRGRDTAVKRADVPNWCKEKRKSRRHASAGAEEEEGQAQGFSRSLSKVHANARSSTGSPCGTVPESLLRRSILQRVFRFGLRAGVRRKQVPLHGLGVYDGQPAR